MSSVEPAGTADAEQLAELAALTFPLACPPHITDDAIAEFIAGHLTAAAFDRYIRDPEYTVLVSREDPAGPLSGYALAVRRPAPAGIAELLPDGPVLEVSKLYVRPDLHGSGVAAGLLDAVVDDAARSGIPTVWLGTNTGNSRARRFYEKRGFALAGTRRFLLGGRWEDDVVYARAVAPTAPGS